jgi:hypothetical protein
MGTDDLFKKRRAKKKAREAGNIEPKADSYLIVCEGEKTETCARIQCRMEQPMLRVLALPAFLLQRFRSPQERLDG